MSLRRMNHVIEGLKEVSPSKIDSVIKQLEFLYNTGARIWIVGNGGSANSSSHLTSDLANLGFDTICLTDNISRLTAIANDFGWPTIYNVMIENHFRFGDCLIIFTVNGSAGKSEGGEEWSANLYNLAKYVKDLEPNMNTVIVFSGNNGGTIIGVSSICISISSKDPYIVEGIHSVLAHLVCKGLKEDLS